jgi:hypothetical protein
MLKILTGACCCQSIRKIQGAEKREKRVKDYQTEKTKLVLIVKLTHFKNGPDSFFNFYALKQK